MSDARTGNNPKQARQTAEKRVGGIAERARTGRRATRAEGYARLELAAQLMAENVGLRPYALQTLVAQKLGVSRRQAARYTARARGLLADALQDRLSEIAAGLPDQIGWGIRTARQCRDVRALASMLRVAGELLAATKHEPDKSAGELDRIEFVIVDPSGVDLVQEA